MNKTIQLSLGILSMLAFTACNSNSEDSYRCATGLCELVSNGNYDNAEECQLACNAGAEVMDIDGNVYGTVILSTQEWTRSNLDVVTYRNGDPIPEVQDFTTWKNLTTGAWCHYENNSANGPIYGRLYNWYAVNDPRGLAPEGWHVASDAEWAVMVELLGGTNAAGGPLKSTGTSLWMAPNEGATNASGFSALPGGKRDSNLDFVNQGESGSWWTSSDQSIPFAKLRIIEHGSDAALGGYYGDKNNGYAVRCVKD